MFLFGGARSGDDRAATTVFAFASIAQWSFKTVLDASLRSIGCVMNVASWLFHSSRTAYICFQGLIPDDIRMMCGCFWTTLTAL
jgi:hypothetical protein